MDFGHVPVETLESISFHLKDEPEGNLDVLKNGKGGTKVHIGLGTRGKGEWVGTLYPRGAKEPDYLHYYGHSFNAIEVGSTFYGLPKELDIKRWKNQVPPDFLFCPKYPQIVTHVKKLLGADDEAGEFLDRIGSLGEKLGPIFLLPSPAMTLNDLPAIHRFIDRIPKAYKVFLELRHPSFFVEGLPTRLLSFLREQRRGLVITDTAGRRDVAHMHLTVPEVYVRFVGNLLHPTDFLRIDDWVQRIKKWKNEGLEQVYFFIHQDRGLYGPKLVAYMIEQLEGHCGIKLKAPVLKQNELF
ncbi:hypothetical protein OSTOST_06025 [Ostertagia ostertagi]